MSRSPKSPTQLSAPGSPEVLIRPTEAQTTAIGSYILDGLSEEEACLMADFPFREYKKLYAQVPDFANFVNKKKVEFKHRFLRDIKAKGGDKNAQWLLEKLIPQEFGAKAASPGGSNIDIVNVIIRDIQKTNDAPEVRYTVSGPQEVQGSDSGWDPDKVLN